MKEGKKKAFQCISHPSLILSAPALKVLPWARVSAKSAGSTADQSGIVKVRGEESQFRIRNREAGSVQAPILGVETICGEEQQTEIVRIRNKKGERWTRLYVRK